jgi:N-acetylmuramoyl-L-alanine amidase
MMGGQIWKILLVALAMAIATATAAKAQEFSALAQIEPGRSALHDQGAAVHLQLGLSQSVPFRVFVLDAPPRLVLDFSDLDFAGLDPQTFDRSEHVLSLQWGRLRPGWSRFVAELSGPFAVIEAQARTAAPPEVWVLLEPITQEAFAERVGAPPSALWSLPQAAVLEAPRRRQTGAEPLIVALDPGHGGIDPGAQAEGLSEATLVLSFARELKEVLARAGIRVVMTREDDVFVPLEARMSLARAAGADIFLSLHADALAEGEATGATVYLLAKHASDAASARLAERHDRADLLAGVDLADHDDEVAMVLMDLARAETQPRADGFALALESAIRKAGLQMHKRPVQTADFSVLKSPDIPSVLLELGFMSSPADRARLVDPVWRALMTEAILEALRSWAAADAAEARLLRQ